MKPYQWLMANATERLEVMAAVRKHTESLPPTALTMSPYVVDDNSYDSNGLNVFVNDVMTYFGFWEMPFYTTSNNRRTRYVNPHHESASRFSDVVVECRCGTLVSRDSVNIETPEGFDDHNDCKVEWRKDAIAQLWRNRRDIVEEYAANEIPLPIAARRLCVSDRASAQRITENLGYSWDKLRERGVRRRWATWKALRDEEFEIKEIGDAFGFAPNSVSAGVQLLMKETESIKA